MATYHRVYNSIAYRVTEASSGAKRWSWEVPGQEGMPSRRGRDCASRSESEHKAEAAIQALMERR